MQDRVVPIPYYGPIMSRLQIILYNKDFVHCFIPHQHCHGVKVNKADVCLHFAKSVNWEENREIGVVRLHIFNSRISNSRKIPGPKKRELGGHTVDKKISLLFTIHVEM